MRLRQTRMHGIGDPFRHTVAEIDWDAVSDGLVALVGDNGAGKTHVMECTGPAPLYRECPSYGEPLTAHVAKGVRDAFVELVFALGPDTYRALVQIDPQFGGGRGKTEAYLYQDIDGQWAPVAGPLVRDFDAAIARILPSKAFFLASAFAAQGGAGNFFELDPADRKRLLVKLLGVDHLQQMAEQAKGRRQTAETELAVLRDRAETARQRIGEAERLDALIATQRASVAAAREELAAAEHCAAQRLAMCRDAHAEAQAFTAERDRLLQQCGDAEARRAAATRRSEELDALLEQADDIRQSAEALTATTAQVATLGERIATLAVTVSSLEERLAALRNERKMLVDMRTRCRDALDLAEGQTPEEYLAAAEQAAEAGASALPTLEAAAARLDDRAALVAQRLALGGQLADYRTRAALLERIPGVPACGTCPLTEDARAAAARADQLHMELQAFPEQATVEVIAEARREALAAVTAERERLAAAQMAAARLPGIRAAVQGLATTIRRLDEVEETGKRLSGEVKTARANSEELAGHHEVLKATAAKLEGLAARLPELAAAEATRAAASREIAEARALIQVVEQALADIPDNEEALRELTEAAETAEGDRRAADAALRAAERSLATSEGARAGYGDPTADLSAIAAAEATTAADMEDWALLERGLGKDGVQALEIDAAGPAVTEIANDLLLRCFSPRWQLMLDTTGYTKDGRQREICEIAILDGQTGDVRRKGSGGETVIFSEALRLALAVFNARRNGHQLLTLWRDETVGALSPANADAYIAMLRRAMALGGFERCVFIAHQPSVWEQADARIEVADGVCRRMP